MNLQPSDLKLLRIEIGRALDDEVEDKLGLRLYGHLDEDNEAAVVGHLFRTSEFAFGQALVAVDLEGSTQGGEISGDDLAKWTESGGREMIYRFGSRMMEGQAGAMGLSLDFPVEAPEASFELASNDESDADDEGGAVPPA